MLRAVWPGLSVSLQKEVHQKKTRICFVLLSAPWSVLCYYAEEISLRVPLQVTHLLTSSQEAVRYLLAGQKPSPQDPTNGSYLWYYKVSQRLFKFFSFIQSSPNVFPSCRCIKIQNKCLEKSVETIKTCRTEMSRFTICVCTWKGRGLNRKWGLCRIWVDQKLLHQNLASDRHHVFFNLGNN